MFRPNQDAYGADDRDVKSGRDASGPKFIDQEIVPRMVKDNRKRLRLSGIQSGKGDAWVQLTWGRQRSHPCSQLDGPTYFAPDFGGDQKLGEQWGQPVDELNIVERDERAGVGNDPQRRHASPIPASSS